MALYTPEYKPTGKEVAIIKTSQGTIRVELDGEGAPIHVGNFVELAQKGFYDNLKFHRYVPGFVIQGGDPNTRDLDSEQVKAAEGNPFAGLGTGGPGYTIKEEFSTNPNNEHLDGTASPWLVRRIRIRLVRSSTSALVRNHSSIRATRCSARPSMGSMSSPSFAWEM